MDCLTDDKPLVRRVAIMHMVFLGHVISQSFSDIAFNFVLEVSERISGRRHGSSLILSSRQGQ